jgi:hypothetical protein
MVDKCNKKKRDCVRGVQCAFYHNFLEKKKLKNQSTKKSETHEPSVKKSGNQSSSTTVYESNIKKQENTINNLLYCLSKPSESILGSFIPAFSMTNFLTIEEKLRMEGKLDPHKSLSSQSIPTQSASETDSWCTKINVENRMLDQGTYNSFQ